MNPQKGTTTEPMGKAPNSLDTESSANSTGHNSPPPASPGVDCSGGSREPGGMIVAKVSAVWKTKTGRRWLWNSGLKTFLR